MLSAIRAEDAVKNSLNRLSRLSHETISPNRRFNLEAVVNESTENQVQEFEQEAENYYEPPEEGPYYREYEPMHATGPVATIHREPVSELYFPKDSRHRTDTDYRTKPANEEEPANYYFEYPEMPEQNKEAEPEKEDTSPVKEEESVVVPHQKSSEDTEAIIRALQEELRKRNLGGDVVSSEDKKPIFQTTSLTNVEQNDLQTTTVSQTVETVYDDMSADRVTYSTETNKLINTDVGFLPDDDGILKTFIDRYTTMLIHDSIYMEELPAPYFMHQGLSLLNPVVQGGLKYDPREESEDENVL